MGTGNNEKANEIRSATLLTERQRREVHFHAEYAIQCAADYHRIDYDIVESKKRRWWNQAWSMYTALLSEPLVDKRVLAVGCGAGADCFQLAKVGALTYGCDISPEMVEIARTVASREGLDIDFRVMPAELLTYPDRYFDVVLVHDILHHVDIPRTLAELLRVAKNSGVSGILCDSGQLIY